MTSLAELAPSLAPMLVLTPMLGAAGTLVLGRRPRVQLAVSVLALTIVAVIAALILATVAETGGFSVAVGGWAPPWGIVLVVDRLSALMVMVSSLVLLGVLVFAVSQGVADGPRESPVSIFHPSYLILAMGIFVTFIAGDLFNMYVGFEILLAASYVLLTLGGSGARIRAGTTYIVVSIVSSFFFLSSIALIYGATGTVNLAQVAVRVDELPSEIQLILQAALLMGFLIKAAAFPLSFWLPDSYPTAPAPVTAVFAGLLTKVGVYAILRTQTLLFPEGALTVPLMIAAGLTLIVGILGALAQADLKRLLSFTLVSHIGYMLFGIALGTALGFGTAIFYTAHHIIIQTALFLVAGLIERVGRTSSVTKLAGLATTSPLLAVLFFIPALNLGGLPPFSGFLGKVGLFIAGTEAAETSPNAWLIWVVIGVGALTSLLTLYALIRFWNLGFWRTNRERKEVRPSVSDFLEDLPEAEEPKTGNSLPIGMVLSTAAMVALSLSLTVFAGPLFDYTDKAGSQVNDRNNYIQLVFGDHPNPADISDVDDVTDTETDSGGEH